MVSVWATPGSTGLGSTSGHLGARQPVMGVSTAPCCLPQPRPLTTWKRFRLFRLALGSIIAYRNLRAPDRSGRESTHPSLNVDTVVCSAHCLLSPRRAVVLPRPREAVFTGQPSVCPCNSRPPPLLAGTLSPPPRRPPDKACTQDLLTCCRTLWCSVPKYWEVFWNCGFPGILAVFCGKPESCHRIVAADPLKITVWIEPTAWERLQVIPSRGEHGWMGSGACGLATCYVVTRLPGKSRKIKTLQTGTCDMSGKTLRRAICWNRNLVIVCY